MREYIEIIIEVSEEVIKACGSERLLLQLDILSPM